MRMHPSAVSALFAILGCLSATNAIKFAPTSSPATFSSSLPHSRATSVLGFQSALPLGPSQCRTRGQASCAQKIGQFQKQSAMPAAVRRGSPTMTLAAIPGALATIPGAGSLAALVATPTGLFNTIFVTLCSTALLAKVLDRDSGDGAEEKAPEGVRALQAQFLVVFWLLRMADWLQGPYFYEVYASKVINGQAVSLDMVSKVHSAVPLRTRTAIPATDSTASGIVSFSSSASAPQASSAPPSANWSTPKAEKPARSCFARCTPLARSAPSRRCSGSSSSGVSRAASAPHSSSRRRSRGSSASTTRRDSTASGSARPSAGPTRETAWSRSRLGRSLQSLPLRGAFPVLRVGLSVCLCLSVR